jgi:hypothetical protein
MYLEQICHILWTGIFEGFESHEADLESYSGFNGQPVQGN